MTDHCYQIVGGPELGELFEALKGYRERDGKTVKFTLANPNPDGPARGDCEISIHTLANNGDGISFSFGGRHGFPLVKGQYNTSTKRGLLDFNPLARR